MKGDEEYSLVLVQGCSIHALVQSQAVPLVLS